VTQLLRNIIGPLSSELSPGWAYFIVTPFTGEFVMRQSVKSLVAVAALMWLQASFALGQEGAAREAAVKSRMALMQATVAGYDFSSDELKADPSGTFVPKPLLRYSDATRDLMDAKASGLVDAGVWRLGMEGRPTALVVLEIYLSAEGKGTLAHEFVSLSEEKFSLTHPQHSVAWEASGTDLELARITADRPPARSAPLRLTQMRSLAHRFTAKETINDNVIKCRLLPQPLTRYESETNGILDGAVFAFANGTNPEIGVVLEADKESWKYGVVRLGAAKATVDLDGREVASFPFFGDYGRRDGTYTSTSHAVELP